MKNVFENTGLVSRKIVRGEREGRPTYTMVSESIYATDREDLWDALTNPARLPRWFAPVEGQLQINGKYRIKDNASGTITQCDKPQRFQLTWEYGGDISWVTVELSAHSLNKTKLSLQHQAGAHGEHFEMYGPGATGVGWDLGISALSEYLAGGQAISDNALCPTPQAKEFINQSALAWGRAAVAAGFEENWASKSAQNTAAFFSGE